MGLNVFHTGLNEFCRKYLVSDVKLSPKDIAAAPTAFQEADIQLFERFLLFDCVTFKVYGENIPAAVLLNLFGEKGLCELAEQKALAFTLWKPMVGYMQDRGGPGNSDNLLSYRPLRARILNHGQSDEEALQRRFQGEGGVGGD